MGGATWVAAGAGAPAVAALTGAVAASAASMAALEKMAGLTLKSAVIGRRRLALPRPRCRRRSDATSETMAPAASSTTTDSEPKTRKPL